MQPVGGLDRELVVSAMGGYFTSFSAITPGLPDFAGTGGCNVEFGPRAGVATNLSFNAAGWRHAGGLDGPPILECALALTATRSGLLTP